MIRSPSPTGSPTESQFLEVLGSSYRRTDVKVDHFSSVPFHPVVQDGCMDIVSGTFFGVVATASVRVCGSTPHLGGPRGTTRSIFLGGTDTGLVCPVSVGVGVNHGGAERRR